MVAKILARRSTFSRTALVAATLSALSACNGGQQPTTQLAAKVNGDEISVHQVNNALSQTRGVAPEKLDEARREIVDKLIYQQLAVQQAIENRLDRSPEVVMAIDAARRDVLTRAYFAKVSATASTPAVEEARKYYAEHPELFAQRRIFNVQELAMPAGAMSTASLRQAVAGKSMDEIAAWLKRNNVAFAGKTERRSAEQIRPEVLTVLQGLKDGEITVIESPRSLAVVRIAASVTAPLDETVSLPAIQQFLAGRQGHEAIAQDIERLKGKATIEYLNEFAGTTAATASPASPAAVAGQIAGEQSAATLNLEKGVAALK